MNYRDLVLPNELLCAQGNPLRVDFHDVIALNGTFAGPPGRNVHVGPLVTVDKIVRTPTEKQALSLQTNAVAVDLETWHVAAQCANAGVKFLSVRVISDTVNEELPNEVAQMMPKQSWAQLAGRVLGGTVRRPSLVKDLWKSVSPET